MKYVVSKSFNCAVERSPRVLEVGEAFGLGLHDKEFVIYRDVEIEINPGDVVLIHGQSGSGKSLLLRDLSEQMTAEGLRVANIETVPIADATIIDQIGHDMGDAVNLLAKAGLSDAWILIRKPEQLSDGQRYRLKLAKLIETDADVLIADEFGAVLDRQTAKVIAYNLQKLARRLGKTVIIATTHGDLEADLNPSVRVMKQFGSRVEVDYDQIRIQAVA